jgi:hypothetical protein
MSVYQNKNFPLFNFYAKKLRAKGFVVLNPAEFDIERGDMPWRVCLLDDIRRISEMALGYDENEMAIALLPEARGVFAVSSGTRKEVSTFWDLGLQVVSADDLLKGGR